MFVCLRCGLSYGFPMGRCGLDGEPLVESNDDPLIGRELDRYQVQEQLGSGAMARVYRAKHKFLDSELALKILLGQIPACDQNLSERFRREAQAVSRIKHPNVVAVTDFGVTPEGVTFLAMELLRGCTLASVLKAEGKFTHGRAADLTRQIARGLGAAQALGFVHRDLKPGNVMLVQEGGREVPKVLDFGLVRVDDGKDDVQKLTRTGQVFGTPAYMAPEQIEGGEVGPAADFYALGAMLYEMLTGAPPFTGGLHLVLSLHMNEPPKPIPDHGGLGQLALEMLSKKPTQRPKDADEIIRRLDEITGRNRVHTPKRGVPVEHEVYDSSPFVEVQKTISDVSIAPREPKNVIERSVMMISQRLRASRPRTLLLAAALLIGVIPGMVVAHYLYGALSKRGHDELPAAFVVPIQPDGTIPVAETVLAEPQAPAPSPKTPEPPVSAPKTLEPEPEPEPEEEKAEVAETRPRPERRASRPSRRESAPSAKQQFRQLDRELQAVLDGRGLTLADIASREPDRAKMWASWRSNPNPPPALIGQFADSLKAAARGFYIHKPFLKEKLARILSSLRSKKAAASLEDEYIALQRAVDAASSQRDCEALAIKLGAFERKLARTR